MDIIFVTHTVTASNDGQRVSIRAHAHTTQTKQTDRVPTQTGKPGKWEGIFWSGKSQGILNRPEKSEKSHKILENSGNFRQILLVIFSDI